VRCAAEYSPAVGGARGYIHWLFLYVDPSGIDVLYSFTATTNSSCWDSNHDQIGKRGARQKMQEEFVGHNVSVLILTVIFPSASHRVFR
jgi:hypothetical protein